MNTYVYINTGVRDLEVALFKAISTWRNGINSKNLLNRPIYAEINTHNLNAVLLLFLHQTRLSKVC